MITSLQEVVRFYYENLGVTGWHEWHISAATAKEIARLTPNYDGMSDEVLDRMVREPGTVLCGAPVIIDDSVEGLSLQDRP